MKRYPHCDEYTVIYKFADGYLTEREIIKLILVWLKYKEPYIPVGLLTSKGILFYTSYNPISGYEIVKCPDEGKIENSFLYVNNYVFGCKLRQWYCTEVEAPPLLQDFIDTITGGRFNSILHPYPQSLLKRFLNSFTKRGG
jgi:hypothetical protein